MYRGKTIDKVIIAQRSMPIALYKCAYFIEIFSFQYEASFKIIGIVVFNAKNKLSL